MKLLLEGWKKYINESLADDYLDKGYSDAQNGDWDPPAGDKARDYYFQGYDEGMQKMKSLPPEEIQAKEKMRMQTGMEPDLEENTK